MRSSGLAKSGDTPLIVITMIVMVLAPIAATMMLLAFGARLAIRLDEAAKHP